MPLTNKEKTEALRKRRAKLGHKRREYYLSDDEHEKVKKYIKKLRE